MNPETTASREPRKLKIATILIGNSSHFLSQAAWAAYWHDANAAIRECGGITFAGTSPGSSRFQNAGWVVILAGEQHAERLRADLLALALKYKQRAILFSVSEAEIIGEKQVDPPGPVIPMTPPTNQPQTPTTTGTRPLELDGPDSWKFGELH